ncbi:hypothetical protein HanPI659440_Chr09g0318801 [Helianthus annuus]|nr:hypothetical protein HanPI659440_Chr09g0318801 [Helianthus annuus]
MNALDVKVGREMTVKILPEGQLPWLEQIKDYFHHTSEESLAAFMPARTGANPPVIAKLKTMLTPAEKGTILLSSEESIASSEGLVHQSHSTRVGAGGDSTGESIAMDVESVATVTEHVADGQPGKGPEGQVQPGPQSGKRTPSKRYTDYVVVSDTLPGLDIGARRSEEKVDEDQATITQILEEKRKSMVAAKRKLDTNAALQISEKKRCLMRQTEESAPSENEVDLSVFTKKK